MKFNYKLLAGPRGFAITRPVIPIVIENPLAGNGSAIGCEALVDSGSDRSIFSSEIAELLGIDLMSTDNVFYVAGVVAGERRPIYIHPVVIGIGGRNGPSFETQVGFMPDLSRSGHGLLGRDGFFDQFSFVKFRDFENELEIGRYQRR